VNVAPLHSPRVQMRLLNSPEENPTRLDKRSVSITVRDSSVLR
jgi:hypothetical protein